MITDKQREARRLHIGGSDVPAILGCDPFRNAYDVWAEKTGKLLGDSKMGPSARIGRILELSAMFWAEEKLGKIVRNQPRSFKKWPVILVNTDGIVRATGEPVEGKTTNITYRSPDRELWGDEGTDQVPERVILQCSVQMMACESQVCHVPTIIGGRGFVMYQIRLDKEMAEIILERLQHFWDHNVKGDIPPENVAPSMEIIKRFQRVPEKVVDVPDALVADWIAAKAALVDIKEKSEQLQAALLAALGDAEGGKYTDGMVTYYEQGKKSLDMDALTLDHPEIVAKYMKETRFRVARIKKTKQLKKGKA